MSSPIITKVVDTMADFPDELQQKVLTFVVTLQQQQQPKGDAWDVLDSMIGSVEAPSDWSTEHDHYLYGTPKNSELDA
ncbi:MAG: hypothetical protein ACFB0D_22415 [Phormidesmis sp.]